MITTGHDGTQVASDEASMGFSIPLLYWPNVLSNTITCQASCSRSIRGTNGASAVPALPARSIGMSPRLGAAAARPDTYKHVAASPGGLLSAAAPCHCARGRSHRMPSHSRWIAVPESFRPSAVTTGSPEARGGTRSGQVLRLGITPLDRHPLALSVCL